MQVPAAQDAVVLDVAREVHGAGAVHGAVDLHVAVDDVKVFLFVLEQKERDTFSFFTGQFHQERSTKENPHGNHYLSKSSLTTYSCKNTDTI